MKTTLVLDDDLLDAVRARAAERGSTMRSVIEDALRRLLNEPEADGYRLEFPVTRGTRAPLVDVDSNAALDEYLDRQAPGGTRRR